MEGALRMTEPKTAAEYLDRGCDKDDQKESKGAIEDYTKAIELNPNYAEAYANRGCAKEELGDKEGALADWQKAADLGDEEAAKWIQEIKEKGIKNTQLTEKVKSRDDLVEGYNLNKVKNDLINVYSIEEVAKACNYFVVDDQGNEMVDIDFFKQAVLDSENSLLDNRSNDEGEIYDIFQGGLIRSDFEHGGEVFIPISLIKKNNDPTYYQEEQQALKEGKAEIITSDDDRFESYGFTEDMLIAYVSNAIYVSNDLSSLGPLEYEELAEYNGFRYEDCHEASSWCDG